MKSTKLAEVLQNDVD